MRPPKRRRLAIEQIESRLMLSGDDVLGLDTNTFNLDQVAVGYVDFTSNLSLGSAGVPRVGDVADYDDSISNPVNIHIYDNHGAAMSPVDTSWTLILVDNLYSADSLFTYSRDNLDQTRFRAGAFSWSLPPTNDIFVDSVYGVGLSLESPGTIRLIDRLQLSLPAGYFIESFPTNVSAPLSSSAPDASIGAGLPPVFAGAIRDVVADNRNDANTAPVVTSPIIQPTVTAPKLVAPLTPPDTIAAIGHSDAQVNVGQVIDELLSSDVGIVDQAMPGDADATNSGGTVLVGGGGAAVTDVSPAIPADDDASILADADEVAGEGGMIPIQSVVGAIAKEVVATPVGEQIAGDDAPNEISGELARVAVMELIAGEADPAAPRTVADQAFLVAADNSSFLPERIVVAEQIPSSTAVVAVRTIVQQGALAVALIAPTNPAYLAAMMNMASDAFAAAATSAPLSAASIEGIRPDARSEAFSQWDSAPQRRLAAEEESGSSYGLLPLVGALAVERVVAAKRRRKQTATAALPQPVMTAHPQA